MKLVILEYGVAEGTTNPFGYDPWKSYNTERKPLSDAEYYNGDTPISLVSCRHMAGIVGVINKYKKTDFEIVSLQYMYAEDYIRDNKDDIFVLTASVGGFLNDSWLEQYKNDFYMCIASGNEGSEGEGLGASKPFWTAIGGVDVNMNPVSYSSYGKGFVKYAGITGEMIRHQYFGERLEILHGTSFACPQHATQVMNMMVDFKLKYGRKPRIEEVLLSLKQYVKDIYQSGIDLKTGLGYYEYRKGELTMEFKDKIEISGWALDAMNKAKAKGILVGDEEGNVHPKDPVSLERLITILDRLGMFAK